MKNETAQHTPAPWHVEPNDKLQISNQDGGYIARAHEQGTYDEQEANAVLIAAAPEVLAALKMFCIEHTTPCGCENCRIIAKAEGR